MPIMNLSCNQSGLNDYKISLIGSVNYILTIITLLFGLSACGGGSPTAPISSSTPTPAAGTSPTLLIVSIASSNGSIPKGLTSQYSAIGIYDNGSTQNLTTSVTWASSNTAVVTIDASGKATGVGQGSANITASTGGITSASLTQYVTAPKVVSIQLTPVNPVIGEGQATQFTAIATYTDSTTSNITSNSWWVSSNYTAANVISNTSTPVGLASGLQQGAVTITVTDPGSSVTASTTLTVSGYGVGGKQSLLPAGASVTIQNNYTDDLVMANNGTSSTLDVPFMFKTPLASGQTYDVSVLTQPTGGVHPCNVVNGRGTIESNYISSVKIVCGTAVETFVGTANVTGSIDAAGVKAQFNHPSGIVYDAVSGNFYVSDSDNHLIRQITPSGVVTTVAGTAGVPGFVNGIGTAASFKQPNGIAVDKAGNIYVADAGNNAIRKITMPGAIVSTWAGSGAAGKVNATGTSATFNYPNGVAVDSVGNVYVADTYNYLIRKIDTKQVVTNYAGTGQSGLVDGTLTSATFSYPFSVAVDSANKLYVSDSTGGLIRLISSGQVTTLAGMIMGTFENVSTLATADFSFPVGTVIDGAGYIYVADSQNHLIRKISVADNTVTVYAGLTHYMGSSTGSAGYNDGPAWIDASASSASFYYPFSLAIGNDGNIYVADKFNNVIRRILK